MKTWGLVDLYLLRNELGRYKIGISSDVKQRVRTISLAGGLEVEVIKTWEPVAACHIEDILHCYFRDSRRMGEWFEFSSPPSELIDDIVAKEFELCAKYGCLNVSNRKDIKYKPVIHALKGELDKAVKSYSPLN